MSAERTAERRRPLEPDQGNAGGGKWSGQRCLQTSLNKIITAYSSFGGFILATQMEVAKRGQITEEMRIVAKDEGESPQALCQRIAEETVIITRNIERENVHPGVKVEDIVKGVQWELKLALKVEITETPTVEEVEILRTMDPLKIYLGEDLQTIDFPSYVKMLEESTKN